MLKKITVINFTKKSQNQLLHNYILTIQQILRKNINNHKNLISDFFLISLNILENKMFQINILNNQIFNYNKINILYINLFNIYQLNSI